jgi:hypothetical protein
MELFVAAFIAGSFSGILVYVIYSIPYIRYAAYHIVEELCKFVTVFMVFSWNRSKNLLIRDRKSVVWYGLLVGLFFAFLENFFYFNIGLDVIIKRGFISWPMHMIYTECSTYGLIQTLVFGKKKDWLLLLPVSILIHFLFNQFIAPIIP